jgi:hypothetical protein
VKYIIKFTKIIRVVNRKWGNSEIIAFLGYVLNKSKQKIIIQNETITNKTKRIFFRFSFSKNLILNTNFETNKK